LFDLRKKEIPKQRVYLGSLSFAPREKNMENFLVRAMTTNFTIDHYKAIRDIVNEIVTLPSITTRNSPRDDDLAMDMMVVEANQGRALFGHINNLPLLFLKRPEIIITARLYNIDTNQDVSVHKIHRKLSWFSFFANFANPVTLLFTGSSMNKNGIQAFVGKAVIELLYDCLKKVQQ